MEEHKWSAGQLGLAPKLQKAFSVFVPALLKYKLNCDRHKLLCDKIFKAEFISKMQFYNFQIRFVNFELNSWEK